MSTEYSPTSESQEEEDRPKLVHVLPDVCPIESASHVTFIHCIDPDENEFIFYAGSDCELSHQALFETAVDEELIDEESEVTGGGVIDVRTNTLLRESHGFGPAQKKFLRMVQERLDEVVAR